MLTCMCQEDDLVQGISAGVFKYMNKPFLPDDLLGFVRDAIVRKRMRERNPPGDYEITSDDPLAALAGLNEMMADIFVKTGLSDAMVGNIKEGFAGLGLGDAVEHRRTSEMRG